MTVAMVDSEDAGIQPVEFLWLEITGKCQLECGHCYADSGPSGTHGRMRLPDWIRIIREAARLGVRTVQFIGGEPTLHPDLPDLISAARRAGLGIEVFSNLVHITDELWDTFVRCRVSLATSYYSDDPGQHRTITGRPSHPRTRANIAKALRLGLPLRAGVIDVMPGQRTGQARDDLVNLGVPVIGFDRLRQVGRGARCGAGAAQQLCGACGDGVAMINPDGVVHPCVMARWIDIGDARRTPLGEALSAIPHARATLLAEGMPGPHVPAAGAESMCVPNMCDPQCGPSCSPACRPAGNCRPVGACAPDYR